MLKKILVLAILIFTLLLAGHFDLFSRLDFVYLKNHLYELQNFYDSKPFLYTLIFFMIYVFVATLSLPGGATLLTLLGGAVMGFWQGFWVVTFASTAGATLAFWGSRFLFKDFVEKKFKAQVRTAKSEVQTNGVNYLLTLRLVPLFPFFLINIIMGLTEIKTIVFFLVSLVGMMPAIAIYVLAGKTFSQMESLKEIVSLKILILLSLVGVLPWLLSSFIEKWRLIKLYRPYGKPRHFDFNTIVIGAGSGGLVSAFISSSLKAKVALIEKNKMGGDCLNYGCIPSKALINAAKRTRSEKDPENFQSVMEGIKSTQAKIAPNDSIERYTSLGVHCFQGNAKILSPYEVAVNDKVLSARHLIIASGARPRVPEISGVEKIPHYTSDTIWSLERLPQSLLIIGAGPIGCELAQAFHRLGARVHLIEEGNALLPKEDKDISEVVEKTFREEGIHLCLSTQAREFLSKDGATFLKVVSQGKEDLIECEAALFATGRAANVEGFGLIELGIELNPNKTIKTNSYMQTNFPNIYACGDVTGPYQLTHMAAYQAWFASVNSLFGFVKKIKVDYSTVCWSTFTDPEVATVGQTESLLKEKEIEYEVTRFYFNELDRAVVDFETKGFVKVLTKKGSDKILGASIVGAQASLLIMEFVTAIKYNKGMKDILNTIHPYPTLSEANKYAAGVWQKNHTPLRILSVLETFFRWTRK